MSDLWTMGSAATDQEPQEREPAAPARTPRRIARARSLPGSRAVVGALLVTAAAVGVFSAYLSATAEPAESYVVALTDVPIGTVLTEDVLTDPSMFGLVGIDLPDDIARGAIPAGQALGLAGQVTVAPLAAGDLVARSGLLGADATDGTARLSFAIPRSRAVGGVLEAGDRVDLVATFGSRDEVVTRYVVREVVITDIVGTDAALGATNELVITLALPAGDAVLDVAQALDVADVFVVRSALSVDGQGTTGADEVAPPVDIPDDQPDEPEDAAVPPPAPEDAVEDPAEDPDEDED